MDKFCRGCLVRYDEPTELINYTEKNRRLFVYSTGLQVKRNDTFTFQLCKDCYLNMKVACNFKKQCRNSDKKFKNYLQMKESGESVDLPTFLKNNDDSWMFRFPAMCGSSTPLYQRPKDEDNESTTTSIRNFITDMMPEDDLPDTEARIIREVIEEHDDVLEDSLDSHWLQDDASIDTDFRLDFSFSPFSTPRSINNDKYNPKKLSENKLTEKTKDHNIHNHNSAANKILDMPLINDESNHALVPIKVEREYDHIDQLDAVNDILQNELGERNNGVELSAKRCTIDRNLEEALKNTNSKEFALEDLLASPKVNPGICSPPTPLINNILFGENLDIDENTNESHKYKSGRCIENYQNVEGDVDMLDFKEEIDMKVETTEVMENYTVEIVSEAEPLRGVNNDYNVTNFYCKMCNKTFKTLKYLKKHSATYHQGNKKESPLLVCDYCGIKMKDRTNLLRHIQIHMRGPAPNYKCAVCALKFSTKHALQMHERTHLDKNSTTSAKTKKYVCTECGASMNKASNMKVHMRRHQKTFAIQCPHCDKGFYRTAELTIHLRYHTGEKPFVCTYCGKGFARRDALTRHVKCHLDIKPFKCDFCKTQFVNSTNLKTHLKKSSNCANSKEQSIRKQKESDNAPKSFVTEEIHMKADVACMS